MTIFLPSDPSLFRKTFDETCDRILQSEQDEVFYTLLLRLTSKLRENPLFKDIIAQVEAELLAKQNELSRISLDLHEYHWKKLWQYHRWSYRHRRQLACIKRIVTHPREISSTPLHTRLCAAMWEFRYYSPLFRYVELAPMLFRIAQSDMKITLSLVEYSSSHNQTPDRKIIPLELKIREKLSAITRKILVKRPERSKHKIKGAEPVSSLFSPLTHELKYKFGIPGDNNDQKRRNMKMMAETDFKFCWDRLQVLDQCHNVQSELPRLQRYPGKWDLIREKAWHTAWNRCKLEALQCALRAFRQTLSSSSNDSIETFVSCEMQIHRRDYESFLTSLKSHAHAYLPMLESVDIKAGKEPVMPPGTLKGNYVINLALEFWKKSPKGKRNDAFEYYLCNCPIELQLGRERWEQIIRENNLDPRPKKERKRGPGKKNCKN